MLTAHPNTAVVVREYIGADKLPS